MDLEEAADDPCEHGEKNLSAVSEGPAADGRTIGGNQTLSRILHYETGRRSRRCSTESARALGGASGGLATLDAQVSEVATYDKRDQYEWKMHEGQVAWLRLQVVGVPRVGTRAPREKHKKAYGE